MNVGELREALQNCADDFEVVIEVVDEGMAVGLAEILPGKDAERDVWLVTRPYHAGDESPGLS
jgi:hypothetical protein